MQGIEELFRTLFGVGNQVCSVDGMVVTNCPACGTPFAMEATLWTNVRRTGQKFYCPNGHPQGFPVAESEAGKLRKQLTEAAKQKEELERQLREATRKLNVANQRLRTERNGENR